MEGSKSVPFLIIGNRYEQYERKFILHLIKNTQYLKEYSNYQRYI